MRSAVLKEETSPSSPHPPHARGLEARSRGSEASQQPCRERRHPGASWMGRNAWSLNIAPLPTLKIASGKSTAPSQPQRQFLPRICRLGAKSYPTPQCLCLCHPRLWASAGTVPWSGQLAAHVLQPAPSPCSQLPGYDTGEGEGGDGDLEGKGAWMPRNIKGLGGPDQRPFCCAALHLPSTMVMSGGPCQLCSPGAWDGGWHQAPLLRPLRS